MTHWRKGDRARSWFRICAKRALPAACSSRPPCSRALTSSPTTSTAPSSWANGRSMYERLFRHDVARTLISIRRCGARKAVSKHSKSRPNESPSRISASVPWVCRRKGNCRSLKQTATIGVAGAILTSVIFCCKFRGTAQVRVEELRAKRWTGNAVSKR
jgi:hypothetical protein